MGLFKTTDKQFEELGFVKMEENKYGARYERWNNKFKYTHVIELMHKASGRHIIQSYDFESTTEHGGINVGLSMKEAKLCFKKMREMGWKILKEWETISRPPYSRNDLCACSECHMHNTFMARYKRFPFRTKFKIECKNCGHSVEGYTKKGVVEKWGVVFGSFFGRGR